VQTCIAQLMSLPLTVSCFSKIQIGFIFLVSAHLGCPGQRAVKRVCVCVFSTDTASCPRYSKHWNQVVNTGSHDRSNELGTKSSTVHRISSFKSNNYLHTWYKINYQLTKLHQQKSERQLDGICVQTHPNCGTRSHCPDIPQRRLPCEIITPTSIT